MEAAKRFLVRAWRDAKTWRSLWLGPFTIYVRLARSTTAFGGPARRVRGRRFRGSVKPIDELGVAGEPSNPSGSAREVALLIGNGPQIGPAIARKLSMKGMQVAVVSRNSEKLRRVADEALASGRTVHPYAADVTNERAVRDVMQHVHQDIGVPDLVIYGVQASHPGSVLDTEVAAFEESWRSICLGAFVVGRESARCMVAAGRGTIVMLGATSGVVGRAGYLNLAVGKFGLRAMAQVMAKELGPKGIHVVHLVIDADVRATVDGESTPRMLPDDLADLIWTLHKQPRSAWTSELDIRPFDESFWEHC
ncbi:MAG: SDR family NAD(P)-dependent oxidoreductase [Gammaproteobacteria bacterium]